jgi:hypothetical protein
LHLGASARKKTSFKLCACTHGASALAPRCLCEKKTSSKLRACTHGVSALAPRCLCEKKTSFKLRAFAPLREFFKSTNHILQTSRLCASARKKHPPNSAHPNLYIKTSNFKTNFTSSLPKNLFVTASQYRLLHFYCFVLD